MTEPWLDAMRRFYAEVDAELARLGIECSGCGRCCRFDEAEHVLYASGLERRYLALISSRPAGRAADAELVSRGLRCPFQVDGRCVAREGRVLGCRLYHCCWNDSETEEEVYAKWHDRLKTLHDALGVAWDYRPLLPLE